MPTLLDKRVTIDLTRLVEAESLMGAIAQPFKDIFKVLRVTFKSTVSSLLFAWDLLWALDDKAYDKAFTEYQARHGQLRTEWRNTLGEVGKLGDNADAQLLMFFLNPAGYLGAKAGQLGVTFAGDALSQQASGVMDKIRRGMLGDPGWAAPLTSATGDREIDTTLMSDITGRLKSLFMSESRHRGLREAAGDQAMSPARRAAVVDAVGLTDPLMSRALQSQGAEAIDMKKELVVKILGMLEAQSTLTKRVAAAKTFAEFEQAIEGFSGDPKAKQHLQKGLTEMQQEIEKLVGAEEFVAELQERLGKEPSDAQIKGAASDAVYAQVMESGCAESMREDVRKRKQQLAEEVFADWPTKEQLKAIPQNDLTRKALELINTFEQRL